MLATLLAVALAAGAAAHVGRQVLRAVLWAVPFALVIAVVNAIVTRDGVTVVFRGGAVPVIGRLDVTAEALAYGGVLGLRAVAIIASAALLAAAVDPDELLRAVRRRSLRGGVTAALATHLIPVLARDGRRLADAQRALTGGPPTAAARLGVLRAVTAGALDRATDVAATLEVRGLRLRRGGRRAAAGRSPATTSRSAPRRWRSPRSRSRPGSAAGTASRPIRGSCVPLDAGVALLAAALAACALLPFADRRGIG